MARSESRIVGEENLSCSLFLFGFLISDSGLVFRFFFCSIVFYSVWWAWFSDFDPDGVGVVVMDLWR
jgi:hypothetical protein